MKYKLFALLMIIIMIGISSNQIIFNSNSGRTTTNVFSTLNQRQNVNGLKKIQSVQSPPPKPNGLTTWNSQIGVTSDASLNSECTTLGAHCSGTGTVSNPYIIKLLNLTNNMQYPIYITNTKAFLRIEDCYINNFNWTSGVNLGAGIYVKNVSNLEIINFYMENVIQGVLVLDSSTTYLYNSTILISGPYLDIGFNHDQDSGVLGNYLDGYGGVAVSIDISVDVWASSNTIRNTTWGIYSQNDQYSDIDNNTIIDTIYTYGIYIYIDIADQIFSNTIISQDTGIYMDSIQASTINNNNITNTPTGIELTGVGTNSLIQDNIITSSLQVGIYLVSVSGNTVDNNTVFQANQDGIYLTNSKQNIVSNNTVTFSYADNILLTNSNYNIVTKNHLQESLNLLVLSQSDHNMLSFNSFSETSGNGTLLTQSNYNTIANSTFNFNIVFGIALQGNTGNNVIGNRFNASQLYDIILVNENGSTVEGNVFIGVSSYVHSQVFDSGHNNLFIYNYWSQWTAPDTNHDGYVDRPFLIDGSSHSADNYPLASINGFTNLNNSTQQTTSVQSSSTTTNPTSTSTTSLSNGNGLLFDLPFLLAVGVVGIVFGLIIPVLIRRFRK